MTEQILKRKQIKDEAIQALQAKVNDWINASHRRSLASLSRESGVSESSLRRLLNSSTWPSQDNVFKLVSFVGGGNINAAMSDLAQPLKNQIKFDLAYLDFKEIKKHVSLGEKESALKDFIHQTIFERSSISTGIALSEVREMFGAYGASAVENLQAAGLVDVQDELVISKIDYKYHLYPVGMTKQFLSQAIGHFYKTETNYNYIFNINEGVTVAAYSKVMDILESAHKAIYEVINEEPGSVPLSVGGFMDTLTSNVVFDKKESQQ